MGVYFDHRGKAIFETQFLLIQCLAITISFVLCLVFNSKKVGASIKNPLLGLKQPWGLRCGLYKQFNIWSMADLCTLPWWFVPTVPCCDCLPTLPDLIKKKRKETDGEWLLRRYTWIIHSQQVFQALCKYCKYTPLDGNNASTKLGALWIPGIDAALNNKSPVSSCECKQQLTARSLTFTWKDASQIIEWEDQIATWKGPV